MLDGVREAVAQRLVQVRRSLQVSRLSESKGARRAAVQFGHVPHGCATAQMGYAWRVHHIETLLGSTLKPKLTL